MKLNQKKISSVVTEVKKYYYSLFYYLRETAQSPTQK